MPALPEITYSEEEALLGQSANELLHERWDFAAVRRTLATESGYDPALYRQLAELGWLGVAVPAVYGGAELRVGALASLCEAMGRCLLASPFLGTTLAAQALLLAGNEAQRQRWLPKLVAGEAIGSVALTEPSGSYELAPFSVRATSTPRGFMLVGEKTFVLDAQHADFVIVAAQLDGRSALLLVEAAALAGRMRREILIDETRRSARIRLDGLVLGRAALLDGGDAHEALLHVQRTGFLLLAAEMAGGTEGVMQLTLEYLKTRKQFGKLIGSYQALKHPMVEILCAIEQGRSLLYHAATAFDGDEPAREIALRMAKAQLGDTYAHAADRAIQFHGAIGFTYECHAQLFFRRAQWAQHTFGDSIHHRRHLADLLWPR
jgi:acyl-CoA dehydrogenase